MELWYAIVRNSQVDSWGITPISLAAPFALLALIVMARRLVRVRGPKMESGEIAGIAFVALIVGVAFLFIFKGLGMLQTTFR